MASLSKKDDHGGSPGSLGESSDRQPNSLQRSSKRRRKSRALLNCAECRRLKLKCDRQGAYGSEQVRRELMGFRAVPKLRQEIVVVAPQAEAENQRLHHQVEVLEGLLSLHGIAKPISEAPDRSDSERSPSFQAHHYFDGSTEEAHYPAPTSLAPQPDPHTSDRAAPPAVGPGTGQTQSSFIMPSPASFHSVANPFDFRMESYAQRAMNEGTRFTPSGSMGPPAVRTGTEHEHGHGTLMISQSGRSKYLGPSAASDWLKDQETPTASRANSPRLVPADRLVAELPSHPMAIGFPFNVAAVAPSTALLCAALPGRDECDALLDSYHRYFGWQSYNVAPRDSLFPIRDAAYAYRDDTSLHPPEPQNLALLFIVMAMGILHSLEEISDDPTPDHYLALAKTCLVKGDFMTQNTLAGVQTLNIMAHFHLETDKGRNGDSAWPLWGLAMRIAQAMGLHRDGSKWDLPSEVNEERRRVFWETQCAETFQANCFSRPISIQPDLVDTELPLPESGFFREKHRLCKIAQQVLFIAISVRGPSHEAVQNVHASLLEFERQLPIALRCRVAMISLPSMYPDQNEAIALSLPMNRRELRQTYEQHWLALVVSENVMHLHRPYFIRAMAQRPDDPTRSSFSHEFLSMIERSNVMIQVVRSLYSLYPAITLRHWWCWSHVFNSAVCMGTLMLLSPRSDFIPLALGQIDTALELHRSAIQLRPSTRLAQNLRWLTRLRERGVQRTSNPPSGNMAAAEEDEEEMEVGLMGWRTRLIQRAAEQGVRGKDITSIQSGVLKTLSPSARLSLGGADPAAAPQGVQPAGLQTTPNGLPSSESNVSVDHLLHDFWYPTMNLQSNDWPGVPDMSIADLFNLSGDFGP